MARFARATAIGYPHYVLQRGNGDRAVFETDADSRRYVGWCDE